MSVRIIDELRHRFPAKWEYDRVSYSWKSDLGHSAHWVAGSMG